MYQTTTRLDEIVGDSPAIVALRDEIAHAARSHAKVLVTGETGTGKELVARHLHNGSERHRQGFVPLNCGGVPEDLLHSELFGAVRGAYSGAYQDKKGVVEQANGGTLFLDEIGEMPQRMQTALLRFLETGEFNRVGDERSSKRADVRLVTATHRDLGELTTQDAFRTDLYYRLNVLNIEVPPLRERREDIPLLLTHFGGRNQNGPIIFDQEAMRAVMRYDWPGNVRQLRNIVEWGTRDSARDLSRRPITKEELTARFEQEYHRPVVQSPTHDTSFVA